MCHPTTSRRSIRDHQGGSDRRHCSDTCRHRFSCISKQPLVRTEAVRDGKLVIPIGPRLPLSQAAEGQAAAEKGGIGKVLLLA